MAVDFDKLSDEEYIGELKLMFNSAGWHIFIDGIWENIKLLDDVQSVRDQRDLDYKRGQLAVLGTIINFEETIKRAEQEKTESEEEEQVEDFT